MAKTALRWPATVATSRSGRPAAGAWTRAGRARARTARGCRRDCLVPRPPAGAARAQPGAAARPDGGRCRARLDRGTAPRGPDHALGADAVEGVRAAPV